MHRPILLVILLGSVPAFAAPTAGEVHAPALSKGLALIRDGKILDAVEVTEQEARAYPKDLAVQERFIDLMTSMGLIERALPLYRERLQSHPDDPDAHYLMGRVTPDPGGSRAHYEAALKLDPTHARAWMGMGALWRVAGQWRDAGVAYDRAISADPSLDEAWMGLIALFSAVNEDEIVVQTAKRAIKANPDLLGAYLAIAKREPTQAGVLLRQAVAIGPWDARVQADFAVQLIREGAFRDARDAADRALAHDPLSATARLAATLADECLRQRLTMRDAVRILDAPQASDVAQATAMLDAAIASSPKSAMARLARAHLLASQGASGVIEALQVAHKLAPSQPDVSATLGLALLDSDPAQAAALLRPVVTQRPQDTGLAEGLVRALIATKDLKSAAQVAKGAALIHPFALEINLLYTQVLSLMGDKSLAYKVAKAAATRIPNLRAQVAWAIAAAEDKHFAESAEIWEALANSIGDKRFSEQALRMRQRLAEEPAP